MLDGTRVFLLSRPDEMIRKTCRGSTQRDPPQERTAAAVYFTCGRASRVRRRGRSTALRYRITGTALQFHRWSRCALEDTIYKSRPASRNLLVCCAVGLGGFGVGRLVVVGADVMSVAFTIAGTLCAAGGWVEIRRLVVVGDRGIRKLPAFAGFDATWDRVERWTVQAVDSESSWTTREVEFRIRGERWPMTVSNCEAYDPPFDQFVEQIRARLGPPSDPDGPHFAAPG
jgi:hypothetical protein